MKKLLLTTFTTSFFLFFSCENTFHNFDAERSDAIEEDTDDLGDADIITEPVQNLKVEMNEKNVLSCRLTFTTSEKRKMTVRYFNSERKGYEISEDTGNTEHYFFLWGMYADSDYEIEIYDTEDLENPLETTSFKTGLLPAHTPSTNLTINKKEQVYDGFVLFTYWAVSSQAAYSYPIAMAYDNSGKLVWYYEFEDFSDVVFLDLQYIEKSGTILIGLSKWVSLVEIPLEEALEIDTEGNTAWKSIKITGTYYDLSSWYHIYEKQPDGSIVFLKHELSGKTVGDKIVNIDKDYNILWDWSSLDNLIPPQYSGSDWFDWTHMNSVNMFKDKGVVYVNSRNLSTYYKIDMNTGEIVWKFGKDGDFTMISDNQDPWFEFAHDPEPSSVNAETIIFYDNGSVERNHNRIIEYKLDQTEMTAEIIFEYDGSATGDEWFAEFGGDADKLQNGNIFVTAGSPDLDHQTRLFEITGTGEIVWEMIFDKNIDWQINIYNAQKIGVDKLLKKL